MTSASAGWLTEMVAGAAPPDIAAAVAGGAGMIVPDFPIDSQRMLEFLRGLGHPLTEYVRLIPGEPRGDSTGVNVVKLRDDGTGALRTHHRSGPLEPHAARSWALRRPRYFALLMVEPGWRDLPFGSNGESVFVPWRRALERMRSENAARFETAFGLLSERPVTFEADKVREPVSAGPIIYPLSDSRDELDIGVRVKQDLPAVLRRIGAGEEIAQAVEWLQSSARHVAREKLAVLERGDLVVVDNNRWAHGRMGFEIARGNALNPREVWSLAVE